MIPSKNFSFAHYHIVIVVQVYSKVLYEQKQLVIVTIESSIQVECERIELMSRQEFLNICPKLLGVCSSKLLTFCFTFKLCFKTLLLR